MSHNLNIVLCYNICLYEDEINAVWVHFLLILSFFKICIFVYIAGVIFGFYKTYYSITFVDLLRKPKPETKKKKYELCIAHVCSTQNPICSAFGGRAL